jgi:DNA (cytosine-5)-methyltransferase 1
MRGTRSANIVETEASRVSSFTSVEICAGAGGQAIGLELANFEHLALVDNDEPATKTLKLNRPGWNVIHGDVRGFNGARFRNADLFAGGVPCPPFSKAGKQLGRDDERDLFPEGIRLADEIRPRAILLENVRGLLDPVFAPYRAKIEAQLVKLGYAPQGWHLLQAADFGVPQLRPRVVFVALQRQYADGFAMPAGQAGSAPTVGDALYDLMAARGWRGALAWKRKAGQIAPTVVGGSKKHGGPDLGPTRAKSAWRELCVDGMGIADEAPAPDFDGLPRLTVRMVARLQGFPDGWRFAGGKTASYRQVGNAFPPPVAFAVADRIKAALAKRRLVALSA